jgi:hypothetical protein
MYPLSGPDRCNRTRTERTGSVSSTSTRWFIRALMTAAVSLSVGAMAIPPAVAAPWAHLCVRTETGCDQRTTVADGSRVTLKTFVTSDRQGRWKWGEYHHAFVLMKVAGSGDGFVRIARLRNRAGSTSWRYDTDHLAGPATYVFKFERASGLTDRATVEVTGP